MCGGQNEEKIPEKDTTKEFSGVYYINATKCMRPHLMLEQSRDFSQ